MGSGSDRRRELAEEYRRSGTEAGVYRVRNRVSGRVLIGSAANLGGARSRLAFAVSTRSAAALDPRLRADAERDGFDAFEFEVLDVVTPLPDATAESLAADLRALAELRRDEVDASLRY